MNTNRKIELRPSQKDELDIAVPLIYSSGPDAFEYVFKNKKGDAKDFLRFAFQRKGGEFSYLNHVSLYLEGVMVGIGSFFNAQEASRFVVSDGLNIIKKYGLNSPKVITKGLMVERVIRPPIKNEMAITHLGIIPEMRSKGLGSELLRLIHSKIDQTQYRIVLDVSEKNPRAKALYQRMGYKVINIEESRLSNTYAVVPNHYRMELKQSNR